MVQTAKSFEEAGGSRGKTPSFPQGFQQEL
jgi:hypothetical protein